ncbi:MAG: extracellular solute-binding protein family 5 [Fibrobacteres bacterium]|nr:extracellular solute-binding protein family 5 [Fibrobacterota bacterium]
MRLTKWVVGPLALLSLGIYGLYNCVLCGDPAAKAAAAAVANGGRPEIVVRIPSFPTQSLEPYVWAPQAVITQGTLLEGLFGYDRDLNVVPKVAESWVLAPDKLTWTIKLRKDKKWSDGTGVTAHDFIYGWTRFCSPGFPSPDWASVFVSVEHAMDYKSGSIPLDSVGFKALDDYTLVVKLIKPRSLPSFLALSSTLPMHKASFEAAKARGEADFWWMPGSFVGNGPYIPVRFVRDGEIELVRNPHYVGERGNVDRFVLKSMSMSSQSVQIQQYEAGELDVAHVMTLGDYAYASKAKHIKDQVVMTPEMGYTGIQMARTVNKLMNDDNLRRAIALAIDKADLAKNVMGGRVNPTNVFGPEQDSLFAGLTGVSFDREEAKRCLAKSSYRGEPIYLFSPPSTDVKGLASVSEAIQSHLKAIGLNVVIENLEEGVLNSYVWGGGYIDDPRYNRPGLTLFPGKVLWKEPVMMLRAADHSWDWMNYDYEVKELRKRITLERVALKKEEKGDKPRDWAELKVLRDSCAAWFARIKSMETDSLFRNKILEKNAAPQYDRLLSSIGPKTARDEKIAKWQSAKDVLLDAEFEFLTYFGNQRNHDGKVTFAHLETATMEDSATTPLLRHMIQLSLDQNWIIPFFSEKLVYVKRPWLTGESMNKFGMWNVLFDLQYINVDEKAYMAAVHPESKSWLTRLASHQEGN